MSRARRKKQIRNRIIAFVMAVAMVFTVVKVNSGKSVVKAGEGSTTGSYTEENYIKYGDRLPLERYLQIEDFTSGKGVLELGKAANDIYNSIYESGVYTAPEYTIYTQNAGIGFSLPKESGGFLPESIYCLELPNSGAPSDEKTDFVLDMSRGLPVHRRYLYYWDKETLDSSNYTANLYVELLYDENDIPLIGVGDPVIFETGDARKAYTDELNLKCKQFNGESGKGQKVLTLKYETAASGATVADDGSVTDTWATPDYEVKTKFYYGHNEFGITTSANDYSAATFKAVGDYNYALSTTPLDDGTYHVYQRYITGIDDTANEGEKIYFTKTDPIKELTINNKLVASVDSWIGGIDEKPDNDEKITKLFSGDVPSSDNIIKNIEGADPDKTITLSVTADEDGQFVFEKKKTDEEDSYESLAAIELNSANGHNGRVEIPASTDGAAEQYRIIIRNGYADTATLTHTILLNINYNDETFEIDDVKVDENGTRNDITAGEIYYTKNSSVGLFAGLYIGDYAKAQEDDNSIALYTKEGDVYQRINGTDDFTVDNVEGSATYDYQLTEGSNSFYVIATNFEGDQSIKGEYTIFSDRTAPAAPENAQVGIYQDDALIGANVECTVMKPVVLKFKLEDKAGTVEGCGVDSATFTYKDKNGENQSIVASYDAGENLYMVELSETILMNFADGDDISYTISAKDKLGNENAKVYSGTIPIVNEKSKIEIKKGFTFVDIDGNSYASYNNNDKPVGTNKIYYTVEVAADVNVKKITITRTSGTAMASPTVYEGGSLAANFDPTTGKYNIETSKETITNGKYTIKVAVENENGYICESDQEIYFVDITGPDIELNGTTAVEGGTSVAPSTTDADEWNKEVYIILVASDYDDPEGDYDYPVGVDIDAFFDAETNDDREKIIKAEGAIFCEDESDKATKMLVYKVKEEDAGYTTVKFTVFDKLGNKSEATESYNVDSKTPVITADDAGKTVYIGGEDYLINATITDNNCISEASIDCISAPGSATGMGPGFKRERDTTGPFTDSDKTWAFTDEHGINLRSIIGLTDPGDSTPSGTYVLEITAKDIAGNSAVKKTVTLVVDNSKPVVDIEIADGSGIKTAPANVTDPEKKTYNDGGEPAKTYTYYKYTQNPVTLLLTVTDENIVPSGEDSFINVYNNGIKIIPDAEAGILQWTETSEGSGVWEAQVSFEDEGDYLITVAAKDKSGNENVWVDTQAISFTIDKSVPEISLKLNGNDPIGGYKTDVIASYVYDPVDNEEEQENNKYKVEISYKFTSLAGEITNVDYKDYADETTVKEFSAEGTYEVSLRAIDQAGNIFEVQTATFVIDKTAPLADIDVKSNDPNLSSAPKTTGTATTAVTYEHSSGLEAGNYDYYPMTKGSVCVGFSVNDINIYGDGIVITHSIDGVADTGFHVDLTPTIDELTSVSKTSLIEAEGKHTFTISATDKAGNPTAATKTVEFVIDKTAPDLSIYFDGQPATAGLRKNGTVTVTPHYEVEKNWDAKDVTLTYVYTPAGGSAQAAQTINEFTTATFPLDGQGDGKYDITIVAIDLAGNSTTKTSSFVIDKAAPQLSITKVDGTAPKLGDYSRPYEESYKGGTVKYDYAQVYGSTNVKVTIDVFDYDIDKTKAGTFKVYDNGKEVAATFSDKATNEYTGTVTISGEGKHTITAEATDITGHTGETTGVTFIIDNTDPTLSIQVNDEDPVVMTRYDGNVKISYDLEDANIDEKDINVIYTFTPAGGAKQGEKPEPIGLGKTRSFTENGTYEVTIKAVDKAGKSKSASTSFVIDKAKPEIDLKITTSKPAKFDKYKRTYKPAVEGYFTTAKDGYEYGQYYKENVKIQISVFDYDAKWTAVYDNDELVDVEFKYQGGGLYTADFTISGEGSHVIKAESADKSGNRGESSELSFIIDKTAPDLTTTLNSEKYSDMDAFLSKDAVVGINVEDDNEDANDIYRVSVTALSDGSDTITDSAYIKEGQETYKKNAYYTVTYTVIDRAGNSSTAKVGFTIDTTRPQSDIKITTKDPAKIAKYNNKYSNTNGHFNTEYTYGQYYNETVAMDMAVFDYNADKIVVTDNDEVIPVTFVKRGDERVASSITVSSEGEHVVKISVTDKSGNEASNTVSFIIDKSEPGLSATLNNSSSITEQYLASDASVYLSVSDTNKDEDDVTRVVKITRPSASTESSTETGALEGTVGYNTEADYEIVYTAIDRAGNESEPITLTFRVDKTAPALSITGITRDATSPENVTITYSMVEDFYWDVESAVVKIYKKVDGMGESPYKTVDFKAGSANSSMSETFEEDGEYRFEFTAKDKTGNEANETFRFILDKNAPIITLSGVDDYLTDKDVTFGVQVDETFYLGNNVKIEGTIKTLENPDGKKLEIDDYTRLTRTSSANFEQIFKEDGIYNIKVTSKDSAGNETVQSVQFTIDKTKPLIKNLEELADEEEYAAYVEATENHEKDAKKLIPIFNEFNFDYDADDIVTDLTTVTYKLYMDGVLYDGLSDVADGFHELRITAEDEVGNTAERTFYFMLDTVKPGIIVTGVEEGDNLMEPTTITVSLQLAEDTLKAVAINGQAVAITNNTATIEVSEKGDYVLVIEAVDDAGNESTMTIKFEYGKTSSWLWLIIAGGAALLIAAAAFFIILGKKRKKNQ